MYDAAAEGHSTKVGEAADGNPIYGKWESTGVKPLLDACGGHWGRTPESPDVDVYHYHVQDSPPFVVGCLGPNDDNSLVTVAQCREFYTGCGDGDAETFETTDGTVEYDLWCPCFDANGSNSGKNIKELPVFSTTTAAAATDKPAETTTEATTTTAKPTTSASTAKPTSTSTAIVTCGEGEYVNADATSTSTSPCLPCVANKDPRKGTYQDSKQHTETECKTYSYCGEGQYFVYGSSSTTKDGMCAECPPNTYMQSVRHWYIQCNPQARCQPYDNPRLGEQYVDGGLTRRSTCVACTGEREYQDAVQHREATCKTCSAGLSNDVHTSCVTTTAPASPSTMPSTYDRSTTSTFGCESSDERYDAVNDECVAVTCNGRNACSANEECISSTQPACNANMICKYFYCIDTASSTTNDNVAGSSSAQHSTKMTTRTSLTTADKVVEYTKATTAQVTSVTASRATILVTRPAEAVVVVDDVVSAGTALNDALVEIKGFGSPTTAIIDALVAFIQENPADATDAILDAIAVESDVSAATILYARLEQELAVGASDAASTGASADIAAFLAKVDDAIAQKSIEPDDDADSGATSNAGAIAGGVVAVLVVLILVVVFIWRKGVKFDDEQKAYNATTDGYQNPSYAQAPDNGMSGPPRGSPRAPSNGMHSTRAMLVEDESPHVGGTAANADYHNASSFVESGKRLERDDTIC